MIEKSNRPKVVLTGTTPKKAVLMLNIGASFLYAADRNSTASLPDALNFGEHASNFTLSLSLAALISRGAAGLINKFNRSPRQVKAMAVAAGTLVMTGANLLTETKTGISFSHIQNTADPMDLAYGVVGGFISSNLIDVYSIEGNPSVEAVDANHYQESVATLDEAVK